MKKLNFLLIIGMLIIALSSCEVVDEDMIIGSWSIDKSVTKVFEQNDVITYNLGILTFNTNNSGSYSLYGAQTSFGSFSWKLSGNSLVISEFNEYFDGTYKVVTSTSNELVIERSLLLVVQRFELSAI
jgi:hypothetical protein